MCNPERAADLTDYIEGLETAGEFTLDKFKLYIDSLSDEPKEPIWIGPGAK